MTTAVVPHEWAIRCLFDGVLEKDFPMRREHFFVFATLCLLVVGMTSVSSAGLPGWMKFGRGEEKSITWLHDLKEAQKVSSQTRKPMLVTFGASWCTFCKKMDETTLSEPKMVEFVTENFVPVHLDFDKNREVAKILEVETLPTMVVLSPQADLLGKIIGFKKSDELKDELNAAKKNQSVVGR
jgi:thiol:disulfide interchange protein